MTLQESDTQGSFTVWGSGFRYEYTSSENTLDIRAPEEKRDFARFKLDKHIRKNPLEYVHYLNRANEIKALHLSGDRTLSLPDTIDNSRVSSILHSTARSSYFAHTLSLSDYSRFSDIFIQDTVLKNMNIKHFTSRNNVNSFYVARIQTIHDNHLSVRGCNLATLMASLSEKTARDLISAEYDYNSQHTAQDLLKLSTRMASIGSILDRGLIPEKRLIKSTDKNGENSIAELSA